VTIRFNDSQTPCAAESANDCLSNNCGATDILHGQILLKHNIYIYMFVIAMANDRHLDPNRVKRFPIFVGRANRLIALSFKTAVFAALCNLRRP
jgi:hypothetical protein